MISPLGVTVILFKCLKTKIDISFLNQHALQLLTENTPNGKKVQILLEELQDVYGTSWATHLIDLETDEQKKSWFLRLNPNGRYFTLFSLLNPDA